MSFVAIMEATQAERVAKYRGFTTEAAANAHVTAFVDRFPDAFTAPEPSAPFSSWKIDMAAKTITIVPPPPPDFAAVDKAAADRLMLEPGISLALAKTQFKLINDVRALEGKSPITAQQYKDRIESLIR